MPPQTEITPTPNTPLTPVQPLPPRRRLNKKMLIGGGILLALIVATLLLRAHNIQNRKSQDPTSDSSMYHFRPGYDIKDYGSSIGDPLALDMSQLDKGRKSVKSNIVYACNLVTITDLNNQKAYLSARSDDRAVMRNFIDGVGQQAVKSEPYSLNDGDKGNSCDYSLQSGGIISIRVYQPPFTTTEAIQGYISRQYTKTASTGGLATYKQKTDYRSMNQFFITSGADAILVNFNGTKISADQEKAILDIVAKNFTAQQQRAKGAATPAYNTPTYTKKWARACDFISNSDIKALTGQNASIYANEGLASGTGVEKVNDKLYNSITTSCARFNTDIGSGLTSGPFDQKLEVLITSYNEEIPAKSGMADVRKDAQGALTANIGDEGILYKDSSGQNTLLFRQGRFIVDVMFDRTLQSNAKLTDPQAMLQKLTPYAQSVATKLKALN